MRTTSDRRRSWWGWGWEDEATPADQLDALAPVVSERLGRPVVRRDPARIEDLDLPAPRLTPPAALAQACSTDPRDRAGHAYGKSFRDVVRAFHGDVRSPPDVVARPRDEAELVALLDWCDTEHAAAIPYGAGSSVVGGVETGGGWRAAYSGVVSIDLQTMDRVLDLDRTSRAARIAAGATGPVLEDQLRPHGLTLRHYPQSYEFSTVGGWIATRSGGHYATNRTHIDDFVESTRTVTPRGVMESRRLPGSGAGPSPDRMMIGSEGILGVITEAWLRLQDRPLFKATASVRFDSMSDGVAACRALGQSGLEPANCRLLDPGEAAANAGGDGGTILVLGFESAHHPVDADMDEAVAVTRDHAGVLVGEVRRSTERPPPGGATTTDGSGDAAARWRSSFLRAPYLRDGMVALGCIAETFETAVTWDRFDELHHGVVAATEGALADICGGGTVTCRFTHVYPDGVAPYFTVLAPSRHGDQLPMWDDVKAAAGEAILAAGGTITHHHAVGRDHRPWYDRQRPDLFANALTAAKSALDPAGILNPGVLIGPTG
jgi:alkyldihydroxyacetonephosphate synthase